MIFRLLDGLAGHWLDWRLGCLVREHTAIDSVRYERTGVDRATFKITAAHESIALLASDAATLLQEHDAENFVQFDMMGRVDQTKRPIRVTVQWADRLSPIEKIALLEEQLAELEKVLGV